MKHKLSVILAVIVISFGFSKSESDMVIIHLDDDKTYFNAGDQFGMEIIRSGIYEEGDITISGTGCSLTKSGTKYSGTISRNSKAASVRINVSWRKRKTDNYTTVCERTIAIID